jgi:hypothetical protein
MPSENEARLQIGEVLKRTRSRHRIDISKVEQETKIRTKYLRALESEEWEVLPGPAYAKGFLRTYAQFLGAVVVAVLLVLGLTGGSGEKRGHGHHHKHHSAGGQREEGPNPSHGPPSSPVVVALKTHDDMEVCLVTGDGRALIDSQTLISGAKEGPFQPPADHYRLDLVSGGAVTLRLDGEPHRVHSKRPTSFEISSSGIQPIEFKGPDCP